MPFMGIGLHFLVALFFAVHVVRTGRPMYWLIILFMFPLAGSLVYFLAVFLPESRLHHDVRRAAASAAKTLDPGRELREAERAFEMTPTAQNQMRLANALLEAGDAARAAQHFEACLKGPFANDAEIRFAASKARLLSGHVATAIDLLEPLRRESPDFRPEQTILLLAQAYAAVGRQQDARAQFEQAAARYGSVEARAEYAIWAFNAGDITTAAEQYQEVQRLMKFWNRYTRALHQPLIKRLEAARTASHKP